MFVGSETNVLMDHFLYDGFGMLRINPLILWKSMV